MDETWQRRAQAAFAERQEQQKQDAEDRRRRDAAALAKELERVLGIEVQPESGVILLDGWQFSVSWYDGDRFLHLRGTCPRCQKMAISGRLHTAADVGEVMEQIERGEFQPDYSHLCSLPVRQEDSAESRLLAALCELIDRAGQ